MKRQYKLFKNDAPYEDIIDNLLYNRGIENIEEYKNAGFFNLCDRTLSGVCDATTLLRIYEDSYEKDSSSISIGILVDCDCDGFCSASMLYSFLSKTLGLPCKYFIHDGKQHGLDEVIMEQIKESEINVLFIPDAGSNDIEQIKELNSLNIDVIILDHHQIEEEALKFHRQPLDMTQCVTTLVGKRKGVSLLINPYLNDYPNKELSGGAVTWKFINFYGKNCNVINSIFQAPKQLIVPDVSDLAMLSLIGDAMSLKSLENRAIINLGLENINNLMFLALLEKQSYSIGNELNLSPVDISFYIAPLINAVIRTGTLEQKELLFRGMCELNDGKQYECKKKNKETGKFETAFEGFYEHIARMCTNVRSQQNKIRDTDFAYCVKHIKELGLDKNEIIVFSADNKTNKNFTGLTAMKVASHFNKPTLILNPETDEDKIKEGIEKFGAKEEILSGSMRNVEYGLDNLQEVLLETGAFEYVSGHENAAGVSIRKSKVKDMINTLNAFILEGNYTAECFVDDILDFQDVDVNLINELYKFKNFVGSQVPEVKLLVKNIVFSSSDVEILGKTEDTTKIMLNDIAIMKFKSVKFAEYVRDNWEEMTMNIVCKPSVNVYSGQVTFQLIIEDYEFVD